MYWHTYMTGLLKYIPKQFCLKEGRLETKAIDHLPKPFDPADEEKAMKEYSFFRERIMKAKQLDNLLTHLPVLNDFPVMCDDVEKFTTRKSVGQISVINDEHPLISIIEGDLLGLVDLASHSDRNFRNYDYNISLVIKDPMLKVYTVMSYPHQSGAEDNLIPTPLFEYKWRHDNKPPEKVREKIITISLEGIENFEFRDQRK